MRRLGLAWNVVRITPERQRQRLADAAATVRERSSLEGRAKQPQQLSL
jgi:hypothetical protein